jgi:LytR cell envelope-related transcriptional attenuator
VSLPTDTPSGRTRRTRRPLPAVIFLLVLAIAALGVWWQVLRQDAQQADAQAASCSTAAAAPEALDPAKVTLRVLNASPLNGKATEVATTLQSRGFIVSEVGNATQLEKGVGQFVHGARGTDAARFMALYLPGAELKQDTRADATVDLVIGPDFKGLATQDDVTAKLAQAASASAAC